jgi:hypothetical protein
MFSASLTLCSLPVINVIISLNMKLIFIIDVGENIHAKKN